MNAVRFSEIPSLTYKTTRCPNPEGQIINHSRHAQLVNKIHKHKHEHKAKRSGFIEILFLRIVAIGHMLSESRHSEDSNFTKR